MNPISQQQHNIKQLFATLGSIAKESGEDISAVIPPSIKYQSARLAFIAESPQSVLLRDTADALAGTDWSVLIHGETGTGKELLANILHGERIGQFVAFNCAGVTDTLFESELFGHVKGAYTGAVADRKGLMVAAAGGTLFMDELHQLPLQQQAKLLRAIDTKTVRPVGADASVAISCRLVAASNTDLKARVEEGLFMRDLYYRVAQYVLYIPPLSQRLEDMIAIRDSMIAKHKFRPMQLGEVLEYDQKGNVRALLNALVQREINDTR